MGVVSGFVFWDGVTDVGLMVGVLLAVSVCLVVDVGLVVGMI